MTRPMTAYVAAMPPVFCALDTRDEETALSFAAMMARAGCGIKLGLEYFNAQGPSGVRKMMESFPALPLFLDLKFHDIPNTVAGAVSAVTALGASYINVHATGGAAMMEAAAAAAAQTAAREGVEKPRILAVTLLTGLDEKALADIGFGGDARSYVVRLAQLAKQAGMDGVVCSAHEIAAIREACGDDFILMVPGIRPVGSASGDQKRVMTPKEAMAAGADHLVIGRPITQAEDPEQAARLIMAEITKRSGDESVSSLQTASE